MNATEPDIIDDIARLTEIFKQGPMRQWPVEDIAKDKIMRFAEAYLMMAGAGYKPTGPNEGFDDIQLAQLHHANKTR